MINIADIEELIDKMHKKEHNIASTFWSIWTERNNCIFSLKALPPTCILYRINDLVDMWTGQDHQNHLLATTGIQQRKFLERDWT